MSGREFNFENPITVSDYISVVNGILKKLEVKIIGEVSELKRAASGHLYFSLKDEKSGDIINCAIWSSIYRMCGVKIEDGMQVIVSGSADIYRARGSLTFKVKTVELVGEGKLRLAYEKLKKKLTKEGIFDESRKRKIPLFPKKIGVVTSIKGAAIHDFTNNLEKVGLKVCLCDSRVEGQEAVRDLLNAVKTMKKRDIDVLVIIRGGGSLQSLLAFDNEMLVYEIVNFPVPVVAGIGHHEDVTLAALAADKTLSTPTAAASYLMRGYKRARDVLGRYQKNIEISYERIIGKKRESINIFFDKISEFFGIIFRKYEDNQNKIQKNVQKSIFLTYQKKERVSSLKKNILYNFKNQIRQKRDELNLFLQIVKANDPQKQLNLGYAIIKKDDKIVKSIRELKKEETIETFFFDGTVSSKVKSIKKIIKDGSKK